MSVEERINSDDDGMCEIYKDERNFLSDFLKIVLESTSLDEIKTIAKKAEIIMQEQVLGAATALTGYIEQSSANNAKVEINKFFKKLKAKGI